MADPTGVAGEVEGDYSVVKVQLAGGPSGDKPERPTKGTQVVWGGTEPGTPWGHLAALIEKAGGSVNYTYVHASDLIEPAAAAVADDDPPAADDSATSDSSAAPDSGTPKEDGNAAPAGEGDAPTPSTGGAEGQGPLFVQGLAFTFDKLPARVWAHPHCLLAGGRPLIVYLHGINKTAAESYPPLDDKKEHMGRLAAKLIDDGKVTPLVIAAPTEYSNTPWGGFDLAAFVDAVAAQLADQSVKIDYDNVSVVGHSGAGGYDKRGMNKIAAAGAKFGEHKLKVFGLADTCMTADNAKAYAAGLKDNDTTAIFGMYKTTGGWPAHDSPAAFAKALGATAKATLAEGEDEGDLDLAQDNGATPLRAYFHVKQEVLSKKHNDWKAAGAYHDSMGAHWDMVPMWTSWALPRFFPASGADKQAGLVPHKQLPQPIEEPKKPVVSGGEWASVPPAPPLWTPPGVDPKATGLAVFGDPGSGLYWPIRATKVHEGRAVSYIGSDNKSYGAPTAHGRQFLADRPANAKKPDRFHAGIDLYADFHDIIVACEAGVVIQCELFYLGVWKLLVQHDSGLVINYGEVDKASIAKYGIKKGIRVLPGQPMAEAGRMATSSMLHFEMYPQGTKETCAYFKDGRGGAGFEKHYLNPTQYLLALATQGK
jgi:hypothetical protein